MDDVGRLDERVRKLGIHFGQANQDVDEILVSTPQDQRPRRANPHGRGRGSEAAEPAKPVQPPARPAARRNEPPELPFSAFEEV